MTVDHTREQADVTLSDEAIDWLVRLNSGRADDGDRASFAAWRQRSAGHELAAREAEAIWQGLGVAGTDARRVERKAARTKLTRRAVIGGGALIVGGVTLVRSGIIGPQLFADHVTGIAEQRTVALADGSSAFLNASTALSVDFTERERRLTLFEGQATFAVAHDAERPFVVQANGGQTRALGTVFDVDIRPSQVAVTVVEGSVAVHTETAPTDIATVTADQRVRYLARGRPSALERIDANTETAWRRGKLIFDRRPLGEVVADLERYRRGKIVVVRDDLDALEVTGVFDLADPEAILLTIEETLPVRVARLPFVTIIR
jgi:transmembrane sensor